MNRILARLRALARRRRLDVEMSEEMRFHLDERAADNRADGLPPDEARYAALRRFGGVEQAKELARMQRTGAWVDALRRDLLFAVRSLRRSPVFSVAAVLTLALCIGANTALFSALHSLVYKRLPFPEPDQLVEIYNAMPKAGVMKVPVSVVQYLDYQAHTQGFDGFALWSPWAFTIGEETAPMRSSGARVTADLFALLGLQPLVGRFYTLDDNSAGRDRVVVLTQTCWETRYEADPGIVGREIRIDGEAHTIVGVAPRKFEALNRDVMLLKPLTWQRQQAQPQNRHNWSGRMFARVKPGVALVVAEAQLAALERRFFEEVAGVEERQALRNEAGLRVALGQIRTEQSKSVTSGLLLLQAGALLVLLLGALNLATLMLVRTSARQAEFAVRHALGAGTGALTLQLMVESTVLALLGGTIGIGIAWASLQVMASYQATILPEVPVVTLDATVLGLTFVGSLGVALLVGLAPAARVRRLGSQSLTQARSGSTAASRRSTRLVSDWLVIAQVALSFLLLVGAALLIRSYAEAIAVDPGFQAKRILHARVALPSAYNGAEGRAVRERIVAAMRGLPGVEGASIMPGDPLKGEFAPAMFPVHGEGVPGRAKAPTAWLLNVKPDFFDTMGIRIVEGRGFTEAESEESRRVYIVDRVFAERHFPGRSAVGARLGFPTGESDEVPMIVGVAETARFSRIDERETRPFIYAASSHGTRVFSIVLRTARPMTDLLPVMRETLRGIDPTLPLYEVQSLDVALDGLLARRRGIMTLLCAFAVLAAVLAGVGLYGVIAYDVVQRTREIGIRSAIGATRRQIVGLILGQGLRCAIIGLIAGVGGACLLTGFLRNQLFEVGPDDPAAFVAAFVLLLFVAALASWLPARRAAKIDPMVALRAE